MPLGALHHLSLTVTDMARSETFYDRVLAFLGYAKVEKSETLVLWAGNAGAVAIAPADPDSPNRRHDRYSPGLHHFAWAADSRADVDRFHTHLMTVGATILDPPAEYDYMPGYYAVFFADPDGMKLELAHTPGFPP